LRTILLLSIVAGSLVVAEVAAQQTTVKAIASIKQIHDAMITPASDTIFNVSKAAPKDEREWAVVRNSAVVLAESGNLLMFAGRAKDRGAWMKMSRALVDAGAAALKAADAKNVSALLQAGDRTLTICETCHEPYRDNGRRVMRK
jgi:hypothetical protein